MRSEKIDGISSVPGGEYDAIHVDGIGKLKGGVKANRISVDGILRSKGKIEVSALSINGIHKAKRNIKTKETNVNGILKMKKASLQADKFECGGGLFCRRELNADQINIRGIYNIARICGDIVNLNYKNIGRIQYGRKGGIISKMIFGFRVSDNCGVADHVECTALTASNTKFKTIRAGSVTLSQNCEAGKIYCDGPIAADSTCKIGEIISKNKQEENIMANVTFTKILDLYKEGKITAGEAEKMAGVAINATGSGSEAPPEAGAWPDDGKLRLVAFRGRKLLQKGAAGSEKFEVTYTGDALDVLSHYSLKCGEIRGTASAGTSLACGNVGGSVNAGTNVKCGNISENVNAGTSVTCGDVGGHVTAGSSVHCKNITGQASAGSGIRIE